MSCIGRRILYCSATWEGHSWLGWVSWLYQQCICLNQLTSKETGTHVWTRGVMACIPLRWWLQGSAGIFISQERAPSPAAICFKDIPPQDNQTPTENTALITRALAQPLSGQHPSYICTCVLPPYPIAIFLPSPFHKSFSLLIFCIPIVTLEPVKRS